MGIGTMRPYAVAQSPRLVLCECAANMLLPAYFESAIDFAAAYCDANIVLVSHYIDDHVQGMLGVLSAFTSAFFHTRSIAKTGNPVKFRAFVARKPQENA